MGNLLIGPVPVLPEEAAPAGSQQLPGVPATQAGRPPGEPPREPAEARHRVGPLFDRVGRRAARVGSWAHFDAGLVALFVLLALALRWRTMTASYWGDEAIAIGIAAHPISQLPHYLVNDGSPPLYYVVLHFWMEAFGRSEVATHALSMIAGLACVPVAWWSGHRLFANQADGGKLAARGAAGLVATCAYLDYYSTEARMYSWLVFMALVALTFFVLAAREGRRRYWLAAAASAVVCLYLQYYSLYLIGAMVIVGLAVALKARSSRLARSTALFGAVCAAAFAPWAPQFVYQLEHTGAPWAPHPSVLDFFGDSFNATASAAWAAIVVCLVIGVLGPRRRVPSPQPPSAERSRLASTLALASAVPLLTLVLAWLAGQLVNSWNPRYLGIVGVPAMVAIAAGVARARRGAIVICGTIAALASTAVPVLVDRAITVETSKSDAAYLLNAMKPALQPGALIISSEVTDTPVLALDLGPGYHYATPMGLLQDPLVVNWSDLPTRLQHVNAATKLYPLLGSLPVGGQVVLVNPTSWGGGATPEEYAGPVEAEAIAANQVLVNDPQFIPVLTENVPRYSNPLYPMRATLFVKTATTGQPGH